MEKEQLKFNKDIPLALEDSFDMTNANSCISIYKGDFVLKNDSREIFTNGEIKFEWLPDNGVYFYGGLKDKNAELLYNSTSHYYSLIIDSFEFGHGLITSFEVNNPTEIKIRGVISQKAILGDKSIPVNKVKFSIPNLRDFFGLPVKRTLKNGSSVSKDRLILEDDKYILTIDKCSDFKNRKKSLKEKGGYINLYNGELVKKKGNISYEETKDFFYCTNNFVTFLNCRRTSALFIQGVFEEKIIWTDYTDYYVDTFKEVRSWPQKHSIKGINEIWENFRLLWNNLDNKNFLSSLIHWYVEANGQTAFSEGSIILAQTALELVYNWWIVENKKIILGKDSENICASNKIRLLLAQLNLSSDIPSGFSKLSEFKKSTENINDAPEAIVYIRNAIVHSQEEKRKKLSEIHYKAKHEALSVYIWYIELTLLCILNYNGKYFNRCSTEVMEVKAVENVPWKN